jgi:small GTP-binding protein
MSSNNFFGRESNYSVKSRDSNLKTFYKFKVILIGDSGVGKTSLLNRYMDKEFSNNIPCTISADFKIKSIQIDPLTSAQITIWDTCGQEKYRSITKQYFKDAHGIILVFDVSDRRSFADLNNWLDEIKNNSTKDDASIVLVGNKIDLKYRCISNEDAKSFAKNKELVYCETSSKDGINIESPFENIAKEIIEKMNKKQGFGNYGNENVFLHNTREIREKEQKREKEVKCCF